ncbi:hypothetical protein PC116_g9707 [Phytophthora cactorum]|uniref:Uncharacterized protein n=2 Tax=Phytophthora cactorum TaxID=29920 RepID=A0A8T0XXZ3_9STRA|nr:hypothetical protein Pcac1_g8863 [Phytophthora cactorum]KAG2795191.1 hypothetical protein PC111_g22254 [Phytophthora cactorum]KAG2795523.1 hypothetical protein PC112_g22606 [Phytophthora cactorum]KAG2821469.1 hypothetical protein PC113_g22475 [Phytophthora cactorum]KAG2880770.1 hypothetical protein PC115_g22422 [Phytophthora cactorum]
MPTDYGSDISDVPMEDGEVLSSAADSESAAVAHEPVIGSRRPREDDPSALSSKRSRNDEEEKAPTPVTPSSPRSVPTERAPWMPSASEIASSFGVSSPPIPLYVCSPIVDDAEAAAQHFDPMTNQRRDYFIGLFHKLRWHASKRTSRKSKVPEWMALCQSWNAFVENFNKDAKAYRARITAAQRRFETFSRHHMIDRLHNEAMEAGIPCAVPFGTACSHCLPGAERLSERDVTGYTTVRSCVLSAFNLNVVMNVVTLRVSAVIAALVPALHLHSVLGFVRPHHFRNVLYQDVARFPCISVGRKSSPTNTKTSLISVRLRGFIAHDSLDYRPSRSARIAQWWRRGRQDTPRTVNPSPTVTLTLYTTV